MCAFAEISKKLTPKILQTGIVPNLSTNFTKRSKNWKLSHTLSTFLNALHVGGNFYQNNMTTIST
jgi:hypothetical protein